MVWERKITKEIAYFIREKRKKGFTGKEFRDLLREGPNIDVSLTSVTRYYKLWEEVMKSHKKAFPRYEPKYRSGPGKMAWKRKVTKEIADCIRQKHGQGLVNREIRGVVEKEYRVKLSLTSVTRYYRPWDIAVKRYRSRYHLLQSRFLVKRRRERYDIVYHRLVRHIDDYLPKAFSSREELAGEELSGRIAQLTKKDPKIGRAIHLKRETLERKLHQYQHLPRAPT